MTSDFIYLRSARYVEFFDLKSEFIVFKIKLQDNITVEFLQTIFDGYYDADVWPVSKKQFKKLQPYLEGSFNVDFWDQYDVFFGCVGIHALSDQ